MKQKVKVILSTLFIIMLLSAIPFMVSATECSHRWLEFLAVEPGCHYEGNRAYEMCVYCGFIVVDSHIEIWNPYLPPLGGEVEHVEAKEPSCHEFGNLEYWHCAECDQYWLDEDLTESVNFRFVILPPLGGDLEHIAAVDPTCTEPGNLEHWRCDECGKYWLDEACVELCVKKDIIIPALGHDLVHVEYVDEQCHMDGNIEHWRCLRCGLYFSDQDGKWEITQKDTVLPAFGVGNEIYVEAKDPTCTETGYRGHYLCLDCGERTHAAGWVIDLPSLGHDWSDWSDNGVEQSRSCGRCGEIERIALTDDVSVDALTITVNDLDGVRDFFIALGTYETYAEVKAAYTARIVVANLGGAESASKTVSKPGEYTVLVRYNDSSVAHAIHHVTLDVPTPEIIADGLKLTVSGLNDAKVIRYAPGEWSSARELRAADGYRAVKASALKGADIFTAAIANEGVYTIIVEYYNGLVVAKQVTIEAKIPAFTQDGNKVTFGNLDDMYVLRYAEGEYATSAEIKRADGAKYLRPSAVDANGEITVELDEGIYTFCVQYNDGSYNYYTVTV